LGRVATRKGFNFFFALPLPERPVRSVLGHFNGRRPNVINLLAREAAAARETKDSRGAGSDGAINIV